MPINRNLATVSQAHSFVYRLLVYLCLVCSLTASSLANSANSAKSANSVNSAKAINTERVTYQNSKDLDSNNYNRLGVSAIRFTDDFSATQQEKLSRWVDHAKAALSLVYGELPSDDFVTVIKATNHKSSAVPWGEVQRNSPTEVVLVVNVTANLEELIADWTIYHEFSHLLIPYDASEARWFSEGLASYYQNIIQARVGVFDQQTMWLKLYQGFERANKQQNFMHQPLNKVSDNIAYNRNYMRIYWSGALYWLQADVLLRSNQQTSLDSLLKQLKRCCATGYMSAQAIVNKLDALSQSRIFSSLFIQFSQSHAIPNYLPLLTTLGVHITNDQLVLSDDAPLSAHRRAIFNGDNAQ